MTMSFKVSVIQCIVIWTQRQIGNKICVALQLFRSHVNYIELSELLLEYFQHKQQDIWSVSQHCNLSTPGEYTCIQFAPFDLEMLSLDHELMNRKTATIHWLPFTINQLSYSDHCKICPITNPPATKSMSGKTGKGIFKCMWCSSCPKTHQCTQGIFCYLDL